MIKLSMHSSNVIRTVTLRIVFSFNNSGFKTTKTVKSAHAKSFKVYFTKTSVTCINI